MQEKTKTVLQKLSLGPGSQDIAYVEVVVRGGREQVGLLDSVPVERLMATVNGLAVSLGQALKKAGPTKAAVEFGVELGFQEGALVAVIARGSTKATLKVTMEWEQRSTPRPGAP